MYMYMCVFLSTCHIPSSYNKNSKIDSLFLYEKLFIYSNIVFCVYLLPGNYIMKMTKFLRKWKHFRKKVSNETLKKIYFLDRHIDILWIDICPMQPQRFCRYFKKHFIRFLWLRCVPTIFILRKVLKIRWLFRKKVYKNINHWLCVFASFSGAFIFTWNCCTVNVSGAIFSSPR